MTRYEMESILILNNDMVRQLVGVGLIVPYVTAHNRETGVRLIKAGYSMHCTYVSMPKSMSHSDIFKFRSHLFAEMSGVIISCSDTSSVFTASGLFEFKSSLGQLEESTV